MLYKEIDGVNTSPSSGWWWTCRKTRPAPSFPAWERARGNSCRWRTSAAGSRLEFAVPARGLFGYKSQFLTDTRGEGVFNTVFMEYQPYKGEIERRLTGSLVAFETGEAVTYGLFNAQGRGQLFITPGTPVYEGMVVGVSPKAEDISVNVCKRKHMTNMRASGSDDALRLEPPRLMSLEESMEFLA